MLLGKGFLNPVIQLIQIPSSWICEDERAISQERSP